MKEDIFTAQVESVISPIVKEEGLLVLDVVWTSEHDRKILRIILDKEEGQVTLDDCLRVSHSIEDIIDVKCNISLKYDLEVSSPGINRPLKERRHFEKVVGEMIRVKTKQPIEGRQNYKGYLKKVELDHFIMEIDGKEYKVAFDLLHRATLEVF